jgi:hypothetical protein
MLYRSRRLRGSCQKNLFSLRERRSSWHLFCWSWSFGCSTSWPTGGSLRLLRRGLCKTFIPTNKRITTSTLREREYESTSGETKSTYKSGSKSSSSAKPPDGLFGGWALDVSGAAVTKGTRSASLSCWLDSVVSVNFHHQRFYVWQKELQDWRDYCLLP